MLNEVEIFLSHYPNILNALIAAGTIGAVVLSLYFSQLTLKPKIKASVYGSELLYADSEGVYHPNTGESYISLSITNHGYVPIYLYYFGCFSWFFLFRKTAWMQNALRPVFKDKEFEIEPHKSFTFVLCKQADFVTSLIELCKDKKYPFFMLNFLTFKIRTSNNILIKAKINKKLLKSLLKEAKSQSL